MSEREPEVGSEVVIQLKDPGSPHLLGRVWGRTVQGEVECSYRPVPFNLVERWMLVEAPPEVPRASFGDDIPF